MSRNFYFFIFAFTFNISHYVPSSLATPIIGGTIDTQFEHRYHVSVHIRENVYYQFVCGGTIIHIQKIVLTAAQCFIKESSHRITKSFILRQTPVKVIAGTNRIIGEGIESNVVGIFIPKSYQSSPHYQADIAILKLAGNLAGLPHLFIGQPLLSVEASFCGFGYFEGKTNNRGRFEITEDFSSINRCLEVTITNLPRQNNHRMENNLHATGGSEPYSACPGDAGAGLIQDNKIIGILTGDLRGCVETGQPLQFTLVHQFERMIEIAAHANGPYTGMYVF